MGIPQVPHEYLVNVFSWTPYLIVGRPFLYFWWKSEKYYGMIILKQILFSQESSDGGL